ncbi:MAG: exo-beta-1,3-glucanase [Dehalococcoidia bacterium]|nr:exo-beta-1,3-glucanase [Dehalococcoidia bacterium]
MARASRTFQMFVSSRQFRPAGIHVAFALAALAVMMLTCTPEAGEATEPLADFAQPGRVSFGKDEEPARATADEVLPAPLPGSQTGERQSDQVLRCVAFGPYVGDLDPDFGPHPTHDQIDALLDALIGQTPFRCIMTYGVLNGLDYTFQAAQERGIKVIAIVWLSTDGPTNDASITAGIQAAQAYPDTIVRLSCGSEFRTRYGVDFDYIIRDCIDRLRSAGVTQPITSIDTWWEWCAHQSSCGVWDLSADVDWIGINVFPWWENKYSGLFPCTAAADAAEFHIARLMDVSARYPDKDVVLTEFGWPAGPYGYSETNQHTGQQCGVASEDNQHLVVEETLAKLDEMGRGGVLFEAFREGDWKIRNEGPVGVFWGICEGASPYTCRSALARPVGGEATLPDVASTPLEAPDDFVADLGVLAAVLAALIVGVTTLAGAAWYARRRRQRG